MTLTLVIFEDITSVWLMYDLDVPITLSNVAIVYRLLNTCIKLAHACNVNVVLTFKLFTRVTLVYWAPRWNTC